MDIYKKSLSDLLGMNKEMIVPFYQRNYDWKENEVRRLIDDIDNNQNNEYFLGTLVFKNESYKTTIIDGQQRISTLFLIIKVILNNEHLDKNLKERILYDFKKFKFTTANIKDNEILNKIISDNEIEITDEEKKSNYWLNYQMIQGALKHHLESINEFYEKLSKIVFSEILIKNSDNIDEHILFSQINSTGKKLTAFDLFKNHILSEICATNTNNNIGSILNKKLILLDYVTEKIKEENEYNDILRRFISYLTGDLTNKDNQKIYAAYKKAYDDFKIDNKIVFDKANVIFNKFYEYARITKFITNEKEYKEYIFKDKLNFLSDSIKTFGNIVVDIIAKHCEIKEKDIYINKEQMNSINDALKVLLVYKIRRMFCEMKEKVITRFIPTVTKLISEQSDIFSYAEKLYIILSHNPNEKLKNDPKANVSYRMPNCDEFKEGFINTKIYNVSNKFCKLFLIALNQNTSKTDINFSNFTVEHIMPQDLTKWYENGFDENNEEIMKFMQTIGNLTITSHNSEFSNEIFAIKKEKMLSKESFNLNNWIMNQNEWNIKIIKERANYLYQLTNDIFDISKIQQKINDNLNSLIDSSALDKIDYEKNRIDDIIKNKASFQKIKKITKEDVEKILALYYSKKESYQSIEKIVFGFNFKGWVTRTILIFLDLPLDKNLEFNINNSLDLEKINQLLDLHTKILDGKDIG